MEVDYLTESLLELYHSRGKRVMSRHRPRKPSVELTGPSSDLYRLEVQLQEIQQTIRDDPCFSQYAETAELLVPISESLRDFAEMKETFEKEVSSGRYPRQINIKALSFSQVTSNDYDRLGVVVAEITPQSIANLMGSAYLRDSGTGRIFNHANWQSIGISFLMAMQLIRGHVNPLNEASSRMSINQWLYTLIELWELMDIAAPAIVPELVISHKKHSPTQVKFQNYITIITGVTDYGLIVYPADELGRAVEGGLFSSSRVGDILEHLAAQPFFIIEAKRKGENLLDHIPQVFAQSVSLGLTLAEHHRSGDRPRHVSFCLTTGDDWLFGIVEIPPLNKRDSKRKIWHTGVTSWTAIEMGQPITIDSFPISLIQMISLWASELAPVLLNNILKCQLGL